MDRFLLLELSFVLFTLWVQSSLVQCFIFSQFTITSISEMSGKSQKNNPPFGGIFYPRNETFLFTGSIPYWVSPGVPGRNNRTTHKTKDAIDTILLTNQRSLWYIGVASFIAADICRRVTIGSSPVEDCMFERAAEISAVGSTPNHWSTQTRRPITLSAKLAVTI